MTAICSFVFLVTSIVRLLPCDLLTFNLYLALTFTSLSHTFPSMLPYMHGVFPDIYIYPLPVVFPRKLTSHLVIFDPHILEDAVRSITLASFLLKILFFTTFILSFIL